MLAGSAKKLLLNTEKPMYQIKQPTQGSRGIIKV